MNLKGTLICHIHHLDRLDSLLPLKMDIRDRQQKIIVVCSKVHAPKLGAEIYESGRSTYYKQCFKRFLYFQKRNAQIQFHAQSLVPLIWLQINFGIQP